MCLKIQAGYEIPADTKSVAEAIFPNGYLYMQIYKHFQLIFEDQDFCEFFPVEGQPVLSPLRLTMVLILQFMEKLSDRKAAEAVRTRIDWKYLLCLELTDQGFHYSVLSEFWKHLLEGNAEMQLLDKLLNQLQEKGLLKSRGKQRTDSTYVLGAVQTLTRLQLVRETMRYALDHLAVAFPNWMKAHGSSEWMDRYWLDIGSARLPQTKEKQLLLANQVGEDGKTLLELLLAEQTPEEIQTHPIVRTLWKIWLQNYALGENGCLVWRKSHEIPLDRLVQEKSFGE